eukprot:829388-Pyramimonas_sp.AAC.1
MRHVKEHLNARPHWDGRLDIALALRQQPQTRFDCSCQLRRVVGQSHGADMPGIVDVPNHCTTRLETCNVGAAPPRSGLGRLLPEPHRTACPCPMPRSAWDQRIGFADKTSQRRGPTREFRPRGPERAKQSRQAVAFRGGSMSRAN